jgi:hypothetical protein
MPGSLFWRIILIMNNSLDVKETSMVCISDIDIHPFFTVREFQTFQLQNRFCVLGHARRPVPLSVTVSSQISCYSSNFTQVLSKFFWLFLACPRNFSVPFLGRLFFMFVLSVRISFTVSLFMFSSFTDFWTISDIPYRFSYFTIFGTIL